MDQTSNERSRLAPVEGRRLVLFGVALCMRFTTLRNVEARLRFGGDPDPAFLAVEGHHRVGVTIGLPVILKSSDNQLDSTWIAFYLLTRILQCIPAPRFVPQD